MEITSRLTPAARRFRPGCAGFGIAQQLAADGFPRIIIRITNDQFLVFSTRSFERSHCCLKDSKIIGGKMIEGHFRGLSNQDAGNRMRERLSKEFRTVRHLRNHVSESFCRQSFCDTLVPATPGCAPCTHHFEIRNTKSETNSKPEIQMTEITSCELRTFGFRICIGFRPC